MYRRAVTHLKRADPTMARVIEAVGPCRFAVRTDGTHFEHIARAIVFQQLSTKAATTIHGRVLALFGDAGLSPAAVLATPDDALRAAGLSRAKIKYVKDLAGHTAAETVPIDRLHELSNADAIDALVRIKGVGRWTADMVLMFRLGRLDVVPGLDLGIRKAVQRAYRLRRLPTPERVQTLGATWAPYGSIATWYLWRSLELPTETATEPAAASRARSRSRRVRPRTAAASPPSRR